MEWALRSSSTASRGYDDSGMAAEQQEVRAPLAFEDTPVTKLPFFKFLLVDKDIAVAQGRSGGVAVWVRTE